MLIPENTFIRTYVESMKEQETPTIYDEMCAFWVLSNALGRDVIVNRPRAPVHLNMYMILVSESGIMRKSTSIRIATSLIREFLSTQRDPPTIIESRVSTGQVLNELSQGTRKNNSSQAILVASELAAVLGRGSSTIGLPALLTDLYDCPDVRSGGGSLNTGEINLKNVYFSFLGGSTPSWLSRWVRPEIIEGGFTSRCYFISGRTRKKSIAWPEEKDEHREYRSKMLEQLRTLYDASRNHSRIDITNAARNTFIRWYNDRPIHKDTYRESFESREDAHILRFAGLMAANEQHWLINDYHIRRAITFVTEIKRTGAELFSGQVVERNDAKVLNRLRDILLSAGTIGLSRSEIYKSLRVSGRHANEINTMLSTMHELDLVQRFEVPLPKGRPRTQYVATEYLKNEQFLADVARRLGIE